MSWLRDLPSLVIVGFFWGVTNPFLRRGVVISNEANNPSHSAKWLGSLVSFTKIAVWCPYLVNQLGSLLFYHLLATSDLSLAVPICNALALVFGSVTAYFLDEKVDDPIRSIFGCLLITMGVIICMLSNESVSSGS